MKKLILILLVAFSLNAKSQGNQWQMAEVQNNMYGVIFATYDLTGEHHVVEYKDTTFVNWMSDTVKWKSNGQIVVTFTAEDIKNLQAITPHETEFNGATNTTEYVVTHGLDYTPSAVFLQAISADATTACYVTEITSTTFKIIFVSQPAIGTNNIRFKFVAYK